MIAEPVPVVVRRARLSRLRLRLAAVFTLTFVASLSLVAAGSLGWLLRESTRRLDERLTLLASGVSRAITLEHEEYPDSSLHALVKDVQREWVAGPDSWLAMDHTGRLLASTADAESRARVMSAWQGASNTLSPFDVNKDGDDLRVRPVTAPVRAGLPAYTILAVASTEGIERDAELLALALAVAAPLIALVSFGGGYLLSRWALRSADTLGRAVDALGPSVHSARLPVHEPPDEIGRLALQFNALLDRLAASQAQNREFVREAAHQIRTPLTLVRGEAEHALAASSPDVTTLRDALSRVERASKQMQRRVNELFLLAEAEAGAVLEQRASVELDTLALESVDLFGARATQLGRALAYGLLEPATVAGDASLLAEALLELLDNACRYGRTDTPIAVSVRVHGPWVSLAVESHRALDQGSPAGPASTGLGQRIVRWIAEVHDGRFTIEHDPSGRYAAVLTLPTVPVPSGAA